MAVRPLLAGLACALAVSAWAQQGPAAGADAPAKPAAPAEAASAPKVYIPYGNLEKMSEADKARARELGESVAKDLLEAYNTRLPGPVDESVQQLRKRADDIADSAIMSERRKVLEFLGLDPDGDATLYYFVSWSMPLELLRSYAIEAMWSGGTLVFKGVPPGKDFGKFIIEDLKQLVYGKGAAANISLDPRLFDAYEVKTVPAIVFTTERSTMQCQGIRPVTVKTGDITASYDTCPPIDPSKYHKVSGAVTSSYALDLFIENGMSKAVPFRRALARGFAEGQAPAKAQVPYAGKWDDVMAPNAEAIRALEADRKKDAAARSAPAR